MTPVPRLVQLRFARTLRPMLAVALLALLAGCSDDTDANAGGDAGPDQATGGPDAATSLAGCVGCKDYVLDRMLMPADLKAAEATAFKYKGKSYNLLGNITSLIESQTGEKVQDWADGATLSGASLLLLRLKAASLTSDPAVAGQTWVGKATPCCPKPEDLKACAAAAKLGCFNGKGAFSADPTKPAGGVLTGKIAGGALDLGPGPLTLRFKWPNSSAALDLPLKWARLSGKVTPTGISGGLLSGAISNLELKKLILPYLADELSKAITISPNIKTKIAIQNMFDTNMDGKVTISEVENNSLISALWISDLDVDLDGITEIGIGLGFTAVAAQITP